MTVVRPSPADLALPEAARMRTAPPQMTSSPTLSPLSGKRYVTFKCSPCQNSQQLSRGQFIYRCNTTHTRTNTQPLTITPNITLMSVSSKQDAFKCHPFYGCLDEETNCRQVIQDYSITGRDNENCDLTIQVVCHNE